MQNTFFRMPWAAFLVAVVSMGLSVGCADRSATGSRTLIVYAFAAEGEHLAAQMTEISTDTLLGRPVQFGKLSGHEIILARSGVGMVNAALTAQHLIDRFHPGRVIFTGIAGAIDTSVRIGDIVICDSWATHDYGYYGREGFSPMTVAVYDSQRDSIMETTLLDVDKDLYGKAQKLRDVSFDWEKIGDRLPRLIIGGVGVTGNSFIDSAEKRAWLSEEFCALITDMESAAVAQVCQTNGVPYIIIRSASDLAGGSGSETAERELEQFFKTAADNSSKVVMGFLKML